MIPFRPSALPAAAVLLIAALACGPGEPPDAHPSGPPSDPALQELDRAKAALRKRTVAYADLRKKASSPAALLRLLGQALPPGIQLDEVAIRGDSVQVRGRAGGLDRVPPLLSALQEAAWCADLVPGPVSGDPPVFSLSFRGVTPRGDARADPVIEESEGVLRFLDEPGPPREKASAAESRIAALDDIFLRHLDLGTVLEEVTNLAGAAHLETARYAPLPLENRDFYAEYAVEVLVIGAWGDVTRFLEDLGGKPRIYDVREVRLVRDPAGGERFAASLSIVTYVWKEGDVK